jgi:hypothetical protein
MNDRTEKIRMQTADHGAEPDHATNTAGSNRETSLHWLAIPQMRYPNAYVWFVFVSSLDIMLTWAILMRNGSEVNPVAAQVIEHWGLPGAIAFKFSLMLFVVIVCEVVGRVRDQSAHVLAWIAVTISALPVMYSLGLLTLHTIQF